jgi:hypothetical protein
LTHQVIDFQYRLPEYKNFRQQNIPIGGQIQISGELNEKQIGIIVEYHLKYGMLKGSDISNFKGFYIPYVFSVDNPVSADIIAEGIIQNRQFNKALGVKLRAEAAVAVSAQIEENSMDRLDNLEFEVEEMPSKDRDPTISEKIRVTRDPERGAPIEPTKGPLGVITDFIRPRPKPKPSAF